MSFTSLLVRPVTIITAGTRTDAYNDSQLDWGAATSASTVGWLAQQSSFENLDGRNTTSSTLVLALPAGTAITARNRVEIEGTTYELTAEPVRAWTPRGEHHIEAQLQLVAG